MSKSASARSASPMLAIGGAAVVIAEREFRIELDGPIVIGERVLVVVLADVGIAAVAPVLRVAGLEPDGAAVVGDGVVAVAEIVIGDAAVVPGAGIRRIEVDGAVEIGNPRPRRRPCAARFRRGWRVRAHSMDWLSAPPSSRRCAGRRCPSTVRKHHWRACAGDGACARARRSPREGPARRPSCTVRAGYHLLG